MTNVMLTLFFLFLSLLPLSSSTSPSSTITLSLSQFNQNPPPQPPRHHLSHLATTSLARAHHLKTPKSKPSTTSAATTATPLSPHSYGAYSISLKFGTPPQTIPFLMDTGSDFVWFPCTHNYICRDCNFSVKKQNNNTIPFFVPKLSSSAKIVGCLNPKCGWIHNPNTRTRCPDCAQNANNCTQICPPYLIMYGSGSTGGLALLDTLNLNNQIVPNFLVGCSLLSSRQPAGIAGFGRGDPSLPSQLGVSKFSYCLFSHRFDDTPLTTTLNLTIKPSSPNLAGAQHTPFIQNPKIKSKSQFSAYYYLQLKTITVGGKRVKIPRRYLSPDDVTGDGGTIVDSGTTFTYMGREVFEAVAREMEKQVREYKRVKEVEAVTGLRPCFNVSGAKTLSLPSLRFRFKGGAEMVFPLENYFSIAGDDVVCLTIVTDAVAQEEVGGPKVILGNFQQQNFYVEYDLRNNKFGFRQQKCS